MIGIENLNKSFGQQVLFQHASFTIHPRERVGLVGRNGHGKTTLLRLIAGEEVQDSGSIGIPKLYRIGYVRQELEFTEATILSEGMKGLLEHEKDHHWKVEKILFGLGFARDDIERPPQALSGGFQVRLNLAKVLISEPDLLLLDEPTNYLDITAIRWVERFLIGWPHELMLITHDRGLMDKVVTHILGIHRKKIRKVRGTTQKYYEQIALEEEVHEKTRIKDERRRKEVEQFITRFRAKARLANLVQSRIKTLSKQEKRDKLEKIKTLDFSFRGKPFQAKRLLTATDVSFSYRQGKPLIEGFDITVERGDRICIIGKNGRGKTTLLKLLAGELVPQRGQITRHGEVEMGVFEQTHLRNLDPARTIEEEILYAHPDIDRQHARNISGAMMFEGDTALKKIGVLSGGEKSRVMLGKILAVPVNLLLLDEPTNHLDMDSCDALLAAIENFDGTLVMVTHNEMFLHALAGRLIVFQNSGVQVFEGGYGRFLEKIGWQEEKGSPADETAQRPELSGAKVTKKRRKRLRSDALSERSKTLKPLMQRMSQLENDIEAQEKQLETLSHEMMAASRVKDGGRIEALSRAIHTCRSTIDRLFEALEAVSGDLDRENAAFKERIGDLDGD